MTLTNLTLSLLGELFSWERHYNTGLPETRSATSDKLLADNMVIPA